MPLQGGIINALGFGGMPLAGTNFGGQIVLSNDGVFLEMKNNSGVALQYGTVLVTDVTGLNATTSTTAHDNTIIGVVSEFGCITVSIAGTPTPAVPIGGSIIVQHRGIARVNIGANAVAANATLEQSATAGQAQVITAATTVTVNVQGTLGAVGSILGTALEANAAKDTFNTIRVKLILG